MANIKNFGLVGIGGDVQFGKGGSRLIADQGTILSFKAADGTTDATAKAGDLFALSLTGAGVRVAAVDASGKLAVGTQLVADLATKQELAAASDELDELVRDIASAAGLTLTPNGESTDVTVSFTGGISSATTLAGAIQALENNKLNLSGGTMTGKLLLAAGTPEFANEAVSKSYVDSAIAGLTWENPVDAMIADVTAEDALVGLANGSRVYDTATNSIYIVTDGEVGAAEVVVEGAAFFNKADNGAYVHNGVGMVQFAGTGSLVGGDAIDIVGNVINVAAGDGLAIANDKIVASLAEAGALEIVGGKISLKLDGTSLSMTAAGLRLSATQQTAIDDAIAAVQAELDASQASLGLTAAGALADLSATHFLSEATSHHAALVALDEALNDQKLYTDAAIAGLGTMSTQDADAVAITGGSVAADNLFLKGATTGSLVFVGSNGELLSDDSGISYDSTLNTLTLLGKVKSAAVPTAADDLVNKAYVDAQVTGGAAHSARGVHIAFAPGVTTLPAFEGLVTRVKVKVTTAGTSVAVGALVADTAVDATEIGMYMVEAADLVIESDTVSITSVGASGIVIIEYLEASAVTPVAP